MNRIEINEEACKGCSLCERACPKNILKLAEGKVNAKGLSPAACIDMEACSGCKSCALTCPDTCITVYKN